MELNIKSFEIWATRQDKGAFITQERPVIIQRVSASLYEAERYVKLLRQTGDASAYLVPVIGAR